MEARLYGILDLGYISAAAAPQMLKELIAGGIKIVQLRAKNRATAEVCDLGRQLWPIAQEAKITLLVNDDVAVAERLPLSGVHVGQDDVPIAEVRSRVKRSIIVGKSTHSISQAIAAEKEGADYIGFGPVFATPTKPDYQPVGLGDIRQVYRSVAIPVFCIGGIKLENLPVVLAAGGQRAVIVSGLLQAADPAEYARRAQALLHSS